MISRLPQKNRAPREASKYFDGAVIAAKPVVGRHGQRRYQGNARRSGFSLLEVTIALVIFVVGALAIVRIFPGALGVVQTSENRGIGARLAQQTLARYENDPLSAPYAIYDADATFTTVPGGWSDFNGAAAGTVTRNASLPISPPVKDDIVGANYLQSAIGQSALGRFGYVTGEGHIVPDLSKTNTILTRFSYTSASLKVYREVDVQGVTINGTGDLNFSQATIDYPSAVVPQDAAGTAVAGKQSFHDTAPANFDRPPAQYRKDDISPSNFSIVRENADRTHDPVFYVSYRWIDGSGRIQSVNDEPKKFPNNGGSWSVENARVLRAPVAPAVTPIIVFGPVKVRARLRFLFVPPTFPEPSQAARGLAIYNPTSLGLVPGEKLSFDYQVRDWRWLTVDGTASNPVELPKDENDTPIPAPNSYPVIPRQIELPVRYVTSDDPNTSQYPLYSLFNGLREDGVPTQPGLDEWSKESFAAPSYTAPTSRNLWKVEPKSGRIVFNAGRGNTAATPYSPSTTDVRVVYRSVDGWGHQVAVAAKNYVPFVPPGFGTAYNPREPWREYFADLPAHKLYFHPSDAGHSLMVSFEYLEKPTNVFRKVVNQMITLSDEIVPRPSTLAATFNGSARTATGTVPTNGIVEGTLLDLSGKPIDGTTAQITAITAVKGVSIRARSAWVDGDRYSQTGVVGYRKNTD